MATKIDSRFLFDSSFFEETLKDNSPLQYKLAYITSKAGINKKQQNLISDIFLKMCPLCRLNHADI